MIITNKFGLPQAFVEMAKRDYEVDPGEYRVTEILKPAREAVLLRRHDHEIEVDVSDMVWMLFGTAVHDILERQQEGDSELKEERLKIKFGDAVLSGKFDLYNGDKKQITDYKATSVWKIMFEDYKDWRQQLKIYAYMMFRYGFEVEEAQVIAFLKDHSKAKSRYDRAYPKLPVKTVTFDLRKADWQDVEDWVVERLHDLTVAETKPDHELPLCSQEDRWNDGDRFAVKKRGNKKALRVLDSREEAAAWMQNNRGDHIEVRPGLDRKCVDYCFAAGFCDYYQNYVAEETELAEVPF